MMPLREEAHDSPAAPEGQPCAFQDCERAPSAYPVVQLPPPAEARNGQPLRIVFRRSPVCDLHRWQIVEQLVPRLRASLDAYCARRGLPPADWAAARWEYEPMQPVESRR